MGSGSNSTSGSIASGKLTTSTSPLSCAQSPKNPSLSTHNQALGVAADVSLSSIAVLAGTDDDTILRVDGDEHW